MASAEAPPPCCKLLVRSKDGATVYSVPNNDAVGDGASTKLVPSPGFSSSPVKNASLHACSPDGSTVLFQTPEHGVVRRIVVEDQQSDGQEIPFLADTKQVKYITFSPLGTYVLTWERPRKANGDNSQPLPNMKVWSGATGEYLHGFHLKTVKRESWPNLRWTTDERYAFNMVTNEVRIYGGDDLKSPAVAKVRCTGITSFTLAPTPPAASSDGAAGPATAGGASYLLSTFVPEAKGKPAKIAVLRYPDRLGPENKSAPPVAAKSFFQAEEITVRWSPRGDAALILTHTTVDSSGESYYGSTHLYLLPCGLTAGMAARDESIAVPLPSGDGPVMDVSWCPDEKKTTCFAVIAGRMPAMASLHHGSTGEPIFLFGNAHRNTIVWSPSGRFVCLAGFGNLAGGMDFWDRNKLKKMPQYDPESGQVTYGNTAKAAGCGFGWSPDSRTFYVSTTSPRMNVDNGVRLYKYNGYGPTSEVTENLSPNKLLAAEFLPAQHGVVYPDRPQSPPPKDFKGSVAEGNQEENKSVSAQANPSSSTSAPAQSATQAYVPPSARRAGGGGRGGGGGSLAERMRAEREGKTVGAMRVTKKPGGIPGASSGPIGSAPEQKSKSALRREKQRLRKQQQEEEEKILAQAKEQQEKEAAAAAASAPVDPAKRAKKLNKLLKQIGELKEKEAGTLNEDQKKKIATENDLREELAQLGL